jgi:hypothetical protein
MMDSGLMSVIPNMLLTCYLYITNCAHNQFTIHNDTPGTTVTANLASSSSKLSGEGWGVELIRWLV